LRIIVCSSPSLFTGKERDTESGNDYFSATYYSSNMNAFVALLRAVNVGGTGKLPMTELKAMCEAAGFRSVRTYIASGNVVFQSAKTEAQVKAALEAALTAYAGKPVGVLVRTAAEMAAVLARNPFPKMPGNQTVAYFLEGAPGGDAVKSVVNQSSEQLRLGLREIYVYYPDGIGNSKLKIPAAKNGTARNMNTIAKLAEMAASLQKQS
jgi:uncharacterized protein (DUF1697 family)